MSYREHIPSDTLTNDAFCLNASSVSSAFSHELIGLSVREDGGKQSQCQDRSCTVCQADRVSYCGKLRRCKLQLKELELYTV